MKTKLILFAILISTSIFAQITTFDKSLYPTGNEATQIIQDEDGGYILNLYDYYLKFIRTDASGYIEWIKEYPEIKYPAGRIQKTLDGGFIALGNKLVDGTYYNCLVRLNSILDTIWTKTFAEPSTQFANSVIQLVDSTFMFSQRTSLGYNLIKIDSSGNILLTKEVSGSGSLLYRSWFQNLNDGDFLFWRPSELIKMNLNLDIIWTLPLIGATFASPTSDNLILVGTYISLKKIDFDGNIIWDKNFEECKAIAVLPDSKYLLLSSDIISIDPCKLIIIDTSGNVLNEKSFDFSGKDITLTQDGGIVMCGGINFHLQWPYSNIISPWILKTNQNLDYYAINLLEPVDASTLRLFNDYKIVWKASNVNYVNIDYSIDNQTTWHNIISYYPADADTFLWTVPELPAGDVYLRISDSFNPDIYDRSDPAQKTGYRSYDYIAANEIKMWLGNNGMNSYNPLTALSGFFWPGGEDATIPAIFEDGLVWGGKVNGEIRVNGNTYRYGLNSGYILPSGLPSDPTETKSKMFKLKKDWQYMPPGAERDRYEFDYLNWPVDVGAPWDDNDGDGVYTPGIDEPKILGDETLFFVANDLDTLRSLYTYGSNPIGLEIQATTFGYNTELLKDVVFKKFKIINKSSETVTDMYLTYWTDVDLGWAVDDFVGCDTLLNLGYTYNGDNNDEGFYGTPPPAVGHMFVQPPIIPAEFTDSARYGEGWIKGFKNMPVNSFILYLNYPYGDPELGTTTGALMFYNNMQGLFWNGDQIIDPNTNLPTHFCLSGDPVAGTGWYEGSGWPGGPPPDDRRFSLTSGPFNMAPNDTQEVVIAFLIKKGTDNINSVAVLKDYAVQIQHWYDNNLVTDVTETIPSVPTEFSLSQNYPNPFNPVTTIKYTIPNVISTEGRNLKVMLKVYDILGSEVATLVNENKQAGNYQVNFDASKLSSGVYFYRLQAGSFIETKKMVILK